MTAHKGPIEGKHFELNGNEQRAGMSSVPEFSPDGWPPQLPWNYDRSELLADALVHAVGVALGLLGGVVLVLHAFHSTQESITAAFLIYAVGLIAMLGISGAYNVYPVCRTKWLLRRLYYFFIYVLIAATYTPFLATIRRPRACSRRSGWWRSEGF